MADSSGANSIIEGIKLYTKEELIKKFGWEEYFIFALMLAVSLAIGIYFAWKGQKNNSEFLLGGKSMGTLPMTMSLIASFMSAITLLGTPAEVYRYGTQYCVLVLAYPFVMASAAYLYLPVFWKLKVSTSYEYLNWRFNKAVRVLAASCFIIQMMLYMAIVVYAPALALSQLTGFQVDLACALIFAVCVVYTTIGGIKAVMWTDTFQATVMFGSFLAVIIKGNDDAGGAYVVFDTNYQKNRIELFNFNPDMTQRHTVWSLIIGGYFTWLTLYGINQTQVQRYISVKKEKMAVKAIWWNILGIGSLLLMCSYAGLVIFAFYDHLGCDPVKAKLVQKPDQLFPLFVMQVMGDIPCVPGLFVAGVFSGALSTVSSGLNSLAAVVLQDFILGICNMNLTEKAKTIISKILALAFGILSYLVVFLVKYLPGVLEAALGIYGIVGGPVLGLFTLGMFVPWANSKGAFIGGLSSLIFTMWFGFGQTAAKFNKAFNIPTLETSIENCPAEWNTTASAETVTTDAGESSFQHLKIYEVSYMWFSAIPCLWTVFFGTIISFLTKPHDPKKLNPILISPALKKLWGIWPQKVQDFFGKDLRLGEEYVPGELEARLAAHQINHEDDSDERESHPGNRHWKSGKSNEGFSMDDLKHV